jgi:hypothetical protein
MTIYERFADWVLADAEWYHFWRPQSGLAGGVTFALVIAALIWAIVKVAF